MEYTEITTCLFLSISSVLDLKNKTHKIALRYLLLCFFLAVIMVFLCTQTNRKASLIGFLIGVLFLLFSKITEESIGYADSFCYMIIGILNGFQMELQVFFLSVLFGAVAAMIIIVKSRFRKRGKIPFIPIIFFSYFLLLFMNHSTVL